MNLKRVMGRSMPDCPPAPSPISLAGEDFEDAVKDMERKLGTLKKEIQACEKKLGKKKTEALLGRLASAESEMSNGVPFIHISFVKSCEKVVADAKASIEATHNIVTRNLGERVLFGELEVRVPAKPEITGSVVEQLPEGGEGDG